MSLLQKIKSYKTLFCIITFIFSFFQLLNSQSLNEQWLDLINKGKEKYKINSYKSAIEFFNQASKLIPTDTTAYIYLLDCAYKANSPELVDKSLEDLKFLDYVTPDFYEIAIASARENEENYQKAIELVKEGKQIFPQSSKILFEEVKIYYQMDNMQKAIDKINTLIEKHKTNKIYHQFLIHIYIEEQNDFDKALQAIFRAQNYMPDMIEFKIQEADIYIRQKNFDKAKQRLEQLIQLNPQNPKLYYNLALIFFETGDYATSAEICKKALEYDPDYYDAIYNVGTFYYYEGLKYNAALSDMTVDQYTYNNQGRDFEMAAKTNFEEAKPYFEKAIELNPEDLDAYENLNTINVLLNNLYALLDADIPLTQKIAPDSVVNVGQPLLFVKNIWFEYPNGSNLNKGDIGKLHFTIENLGNITGYNLELVIIQPVIIPGISYPEIPTIDSLIPGETKNIQIPVNFQPNDASVTGIEKVEGAENKLRVYVKEMAGYNSDLVEFNINLSTDLYAGDESIDIADTEDIDYFSPVPKARNYLFILSIDNYKHWEPLHNAVNDAKTLKQVLLSKYLFKKENVFELYNSEATHENIRNELIKIKNEITPKDNLIIYYAGHGDYDPEFDEGAWVPVDAEKSDKSDYIGNSVLLEYLTKLKSFHTLLIADACFSGSLFIADNKLNYEPGNDKLQSKWAFSSGNIEYVSDGVVGEHSPFATFLIESLRENKRDKISTTDIIGYVNYKVKSVSDQSPVGKPLKLAGNEGGEFVFYSR